MTAPTGEQQPAPQQAPAPQATPAPQSPPNPAPAPPQPQTPRTFTQDEFNSFEARVKREYRAKEQALQADADFGKRLKELLGGTGPTGTPEEQVQQLTAERNTDKTRIAELEADKLRYKLAATAQLHPTLWDRVRGNSEAEILADIETLKPANAALAAAPGAPGVTTPPATPPGPAPNPQQGNPSTNDGKTGSTKSGRDLFKERNGRKQEPAAD
jgi:hypothetical protein